MKIDAIHVSLEIQNALTTLGIKQNENVTFFLLNNARKEKIDRLTNNELDDTQAETNKINAAYNTVLKFLTTQPSYARELFELGVNELYDANALNFKLDELKLKNGAVIGYNVQLAAAQQKLLVELNAKSTPKTQAEAEQDQFLFDYKTAFLNRLELNIGINHDLYLILDEKLKNNKYLLALGELGKKGYFCSVVTKTEGNLKEYIFNFDDFDINAPWCKAEYLSQDAMWDEIFCNYSLFESKQEVQDELTNVPKNFPSALNNIPEICRLESRPLLEANLQTLVRAKKINLDTFFAPELIEKITQFPIFLDLLNDKQFTDHHANDLIFNPQKFILDFDAKNKTLSDLYLFYFQRSAQLTIEPNPAYIDAFNACYDAYKKNPSRYNTLLVGNSYLHFSINKRDTSNILPTLLPPLLSLENTLDSNSFDVLYNQKAACNKINPSELLFNKVFDIYKYTKQDQIFINLFNENNGYLTLALKMIQENYGDSILPDDIATKYYDIIFSLYQNPPEEITYDAFKTRAADTLKDAIAAATHAGVTASLAQTQNDPAPTVDLVAPTTTPTTKEETPTAQPTFFQRHKRALIGLGIGLGIAIGIGVLVAATIFTLGAVHIITASTLFTLLVTVAVPTTLKFLTLPAATAATAEAIVIGTGAGSTAGIAAGLGVTGAAIGHGLDKKAKRTREADEVLDIAPVKRARNDGDSAASTPAGSQTYNKP